MKADGRAHVSSPALVGCDKAENGTNLSEAIHEAAGTTEMSILGGDCSVGALCGTKPVWPG